MSCGLVRSGRKSFKRFIKTILEQLSTHIAEYPPADQLLLTDFLSVLQCYEEADYQRNKLSQRFETYKNRTLGTDKYLRTPFLWFSESYFSNAILLLNVSKYHADTFYEYLVKHLRDSANILGVYSLVLDHIPLTNIKWEQLQYSCEKLLIPLIKIQLQILNAVYSYITEEGVYSLDPRKLKAAIVKKVEFPRKIRPSEELTRLFTQVDARWFLRFSSPAFGLNRVFFHIELKGSTSLADVIDFQDPGNTVLTVSDVYRSNDLSNTYTGAFLVPTKEIEQLKIHLQICEQQGYLILKEFSTITTGSISASLTHYQAKNRWKIPSQTKLKRLTPLLKRKHPRERQPEQLTLFSPPPSTLQWHFSQHPLPTKIIKFYCERANDYSYPNLPLQLINVQYPESFSRPEIGLLRQLLYNQVVMIGFVPLRLVYEFSLDWYWIILPRIPFFQLKRFLSLFPFSEISVTENSINIRVRLPPKLVNWIKNDLNWPVISIIPEFLPPTIQFDWFNALKLEWQTPDIFQGKRS